MVEEILVREATVLLNYAYDQLLELRFPFMIGLIKKDLPSKQKKDQVDDQGGSFERERDNLVNVASYIVT